MKALVITIVVVAALLLLAFSNPTMLSYENYIRQEILKGANAKDDTTKAFGIVFGGLASSMFANATVRNDYVLWSTYETALGHDKMEVLGAAGNFFVLRDPR
jgi:hypothetical protein